MERDINITDTDRIEWLERERVKHGHISFTRHGIEWIKLFTISTQHMYQSPTIRDAIDKAIEKTKSK